MGDQGVHENELRTEECAVHIESEAKLVEELDDPWALAEPALNDTPWKGDLFLVWY